VKGIKVNVLHMYINMTNSYYSSLLEQEYFIQVLLGLMITKY
jgi:nicotinamide riboside transporter PnuC